MLMATIMKLHRYIDHDSQMTPIDFRSLGKSEFHLSLLPDPLIYQYVDNCCPFCEHWSVDTWAIKRRPFKSRRRNMPSSGQSRESSVSRDFSPHNLDHMPSGDAMHRSLPGDDTGQNLPVDRSGDFTGHRSPINIDRSGHRSCYDRCPVNLSLVIDRSGHRSYYDRSGHRSTGHRSWSPTVPVTVDVDTALSPRFYLSDVSGYSSTSGLSSYDSSSTSTSPHHYRTGRRSRSPSVSRPITPALWETFDQETSFPAPLNSTSSIRRSLTPRSPRRFFSEESSDTIPPVSASIFASTHTSAVPTTTEHNLYSNTSLHTYQAQGTGVNLTTSAAFSAPRVSSTLHRSIPRAAATPSNPNTLWIQQSPGIFVPFSTDPLPETAGIHSESADLISDRPNSPAISLMVPENDPLMIEADESSIPTSVSTGFNQYNAPADGSIEAGSESNEVELYYLASINQVYELMFNTLDEDFCPRPSLSLTGSAVTVTEQATSGVDLRLPIGSSTMAVFQSLEPANKPSPSPWKAPKELTEPKQMDGGKSYKAPVPDPSTGLDLSKLPVPDADITVPLSLLENWELRERHSICLANQLDLMAATALDLVWELSDSIPEELHALLIHLSRTTQCLSHNAASSMSEMLRLRRDLILSSLPNNFLLETGVNSLRTAPLTADSLFGGRIQSALTADREDQIHASLARSNYGQRPVPPGAPPAKNAKRDSFPTKRPSAPRQPTNRPPFQNRTSSYRKPSVNQNWSKGKPNADKKSLNPSSGKVGPPKGQP
ncbi:hypothetical protein DPMN_059322 [Dreissena polymorpha]|uniref:Uncharacterized protein n=1 Tax=Dreissena polymorpha TaxID=45954 RepID=A0A9D4HGI7_DREPO|nr:hypothetical protein DPMN_059322 [Dreissena polymorpha]